MSYVIPLAVAAAVVVEAAGRFFQIDKNIVTGIRTLVVITGIWFAVKVAREADAAHSTDRPPRSNAILGSVPRQNVSSATFKLARVGGKDSL